MASVITIRGAACLTCLGDDLEQQVSSIADGVTGLRPLREMKDAPSGFEGLHSGWIQPRERLSHRIWSPLSVIAMEVARKAVADAGWTDLSEVPVFFATSRGNLAGSREPWPGRRPASLMAASNSLFAEPAAAIASDFGIAAPWQVVSSGCCAGQDALHMASVWLRAGESRRALVVAADLPLVTSVLEDYRKSGILAVDDQPGMQPAEGAAAVCLEIGEPSPGDKAPRLLESRSVSEPGARFGGNRPLDRLRETLVRLLDQHGPPSFVIPHQSGTRIHRLHEQAALLQVFDESLPQIPMKPFTGHCVGASSLIELALGCSILESTRNAGSFLKISSALGGKHTCTWLQKS